MWLIVCILIVVDNVAYKYTWYYGGEFVDILRVFSTNVRKYRLNINLSQEQLAEKCGMHRTYISGIECCRRSISLENIQRIADALNVETYKLFLEERD